MVPSCGSLETVLVNFAITMLCFSKQWGPSYFRDSSPIYQYGCIAVKNVRLLFCIIPYTRKENDICNEVNHFFKKICPSMPNPLSMDLYKDS